MEKRERENVESGGGSRVVEDAGIINKAREKSALSSGNVEESAVQMRLKQEAAKK